MRLTLLRHAALLALSAAAPAFAQSLPPDAGPGQTISPPAAAMPIAHRHHRVTAIAASSGGAWAHEPGTGQSGPASSTASNITAGDTRSDIAPHLPMPSAGGAGDPVTYLQAALRALAGRRTGEAQQALEMAETRLLDRSTPASNTNYTSQSPAVAAVGQARADLAAGNLARAQAAIQTALASAYPK